MVQLLYGLTNSSIASASKHLNKLQIKHSILIKDSRNLNLPFKLQSFIYSGITTLLFNSTTAFKIWLTVPNIRKLPVVCIVVDSPISLVDIQGIQFLDIPENVSGINSKPLDMSKEVLVHIWKPTSNASDINWENLIVSVDYIKTVRKNNLKFNNDIQVKRTNKIIANLILEQGEQFLDKYNTFVMQGLRYNKDVDKQDIVAIILDFLFGRTAQDKFLEDIKAHLPSRGKGLTIFSDFMDYINGEKGKKILKTLKYINTLIDKGLTEKEINFDKIAKDNQMKDYDIRYLSIVYSRIRAHKDTDRSKRRNKGV